MRRETGAIVIGIGVEIIFIILGVQIKTMPLTLAIIGYTAGALLILYGLVCLIRPKLQAESHTIQEVAASPSSTDQFFILENLSHKVYEPRLGASPVFEGCKLALTIHVT